MSSRAGAKIIGTVRKHGDLARAATTAVTHALALDEPDPAAAIRAHAPGGVDRIIEVARDGALSVAVDSVFPLEQAAQGHNRIDAGARGRVLLAIPD